MEFLAGLNNMPREGRIALLAQLNALSGWALLNQEMQQRAKQLESGTLRALSTVARSVNPRSPLGRQIERLDRNTDWPTDLIQSRVAAETETLTRLDDYSLSQRFRQRIREIAGVSPSATEQAVAETIVRRAARALKLDSLPLHQLEYQVYTASIREQMDALRKQLMKMNPAEQERFTELIGQQLQKLSEGEREAIRQATGLDHLSAGAIRDLIKTTSATVLAQMLLGATGFGAYLFLSTVLHAFSLLVGMTFSFGVYTLASSALAFLLSGPFLLLTIAVSGGFIKHRTDQQLNDQLAKMLVMIGRQQCQIGSS